MNERREGSQGIGIARRHFVSIGQGLRCTVVESSIHGGVVVALDTDDDRRDLFQLSQLGAHQSSEALDDRPLSLLIVEQPIGHGLGIRVRRAHVQVLRLRSRGHGDRAADNKKYTYDLPIAHGDSVRSRTPRV